MCACVCLRVCWESTFTTSINIFKYLISSVLYHAYFIKKYCFTRIVFQFIFIETATENIVSRNLRNLYHSGYMVNTLIVPFNTSLSEIPINK